MTAIRVHCKSCAKILSVKVQKANPGNLDRQLYFWQEYILPGFKKKIVALVPYHKCLRCMRNH